MLFYGNTAGTSGTRTPPLVPFTGKAAPYCFSFMFGFDSVMTEAPSIHLSGLAEGCMSLMFYYCQKMTAGPKEICPDADFQTLPAKCFLQMFYGCGKMESANAVEALGSVRTVGAKALWSMFGRCAKLSDLGTGTGEGQVIALDFEGEGGARQMFQGCSSLPYEVSISVTGPSEGLCHQMFEGCSSLTGADFYLVLEGSHSSDTTGAFEGMFSGCTSLKTASGTIDVDGVDDSATRMCCQMFQGCTSLEEFYATMPSGIPSYGCYQMFSGCVSLNLVDSLFLDSVKSYGCS